MTNTTQLLMDAGTEDLIRSLGLSRQMEYVLIDLFSEPRAAAQSQEKAK